RLHLARVAPTDDVGDANPRRVVLASVAGRRDALRPRERCRELFACGTRHKAEQPLALIRAGDDEPVRVDRRLRRPTDLQARHHAELAEQAEDAVGQLAADRSVLEDDARPAVHVRPRAVAEPQTGDERALVLLRLVPDQVGKALLVAVPPETEALPPPHLDEPRAHADPLLTPRSDDTA